MLFYINYLLSSFINIRLVRKYWGRKIAYYLFLWGIFMLNGLRLDAQKDANEGLKINGLWNESYGHRWAFYNLLL